VNTWQAGMRLEALDRKTPSLICVATVGMQIRYNAIKRICMKVGNAFPWNFDRFYCSQMWVLILLC